MRTAIDSYCWHRQFGDWYPGIQADPGERRTIFDVIETAHRLGVAGLSLETCYLPALDDGGIAALRDALDRRGLERVWAWGHPDGLGSGSRADAVPDLIRHIGLARRAGAGVMRICCGGRRTRPDSWTAHKAALLPLLDRIVGPAEENGVVLAIENHIDFRAAELAELIDTVGSPWLRVCFDTANNLRMGEDPLETAALLAPLAAATHIKDVAALSPGSTAFQDWPSVPLGQGDARIAETLALLRATGYRGLLAIEIDYLHPDHGPEDEAVARSVAFLDRHLRG